MADGKPVIPGGEGAILFVPVDAALDTVPLPVKRRRPTAG
jgi:hypothetical protein